jgi:hypothetical protein
VKGKSKPKPKRADKRRKKSLDLNPLTHALKRVKGVVSGAMAEGETFNPGDHVDDMRSAAEELQSAVAEFKRAIKRRMLADGLTVPRKDKPYLILLPGRPEGSTDPDDYEVNPESLKKRRKKYVM